MSLGFLTVTAPSAVPRARRPPSAAPCGWLSATLPARSPERPRRRCSGSRGGFPGSSVTAFGVLGTTNVIDTLGTDGREILEVVGKSLGFMGNNNMDKGSAFAHQLVALNPIWAHKVHADFPKME